MHSLHLLNNGAADIDCLFQHLNFICFGKAYD